jgi:hypothetical protein
MVSKYVDNGDGVGPVWTGTPDEEQLFRVGLLDGNLLTLWQSATDYQERYISGAAIGLLTIGVIRQLPKSSDVMAWINSVWALYYQRKPLVTADHVDCDFSNAGPMPYTVPELQEEVMGVTISHGDGASIEPSVAVML